MDEPQTKETFRATTLHTRNILLAVAGVLVTALAVTFILSYDAGRPRVDLGESTRKSAKPSTRPPSVLEPRPRNPIQDRLRKRGRGESLPFFEPADPPPPRLATERPAAPPAPKLYERALSSKIRRGGEAGRPRRASRETDGHLADAITDLERQEEELRRTLGSADLPSGSLPSGLSPSAAPSGVSVEAPRFLEAPSGDRLDQGTLIEAQLLSAIHSDLPGAIVGQVSRDVFDSARYRKVLIPAGSRVIGEYESGLAVGANRLVVLWDRILFPDGRRLELPRQAGVDSRGRHGLSGRINRHTFQIFRDAFLLSLVSAGFELSQPTRAAANTLSRSDLAVTGISRELEQAAAEILRRRGGIPPTIEIPAGTRFQILLAQDLVFPSPSVDPISARGRDSRILP